MQVALGSGSWLELDLLRRRREQMGLEQPKPIPAQALLLKGSLIGGGVLGLVSLVCLAVFLYSGWLAQRQQELLPSEAEYLKQQSEIARIGSELKVLKSSNQILADGIAGITSGSALLAELAQLTPSGLQITKLSQQSTSLQIFGLVNQPLGLQTINALELTLQQSPFFLPSSVVLVKAQESSGATQSSSASGTPAGQAAAPPKQLAFELTAGFAPDAAVASRDRLKPLGALGLARRVDLLRREGLLQ